MWAWMLAMQLACADCLVADTWDSRLQLCPALPGFPCETVGEEFF